MLDPQAKSILTSILLALATAATTWGVTHGLVPAADQNVIANDLVTAVFAGATGLIGWWKARQVAPKALIAAVNNADNGVKVVSSAVPAPTATEPTK